MPEAARISDMHVCPQPSHVGGPVFSGSADVIVGFLPAARVNDSLVCPPVGPADRIQSGSATVLINNRSAARRTDPCAHGGRIVVGCPTVLIGDTPQSFAMRAAAARATPFCEDCAGTPQRTYTSSEPSDATPTDPRTATLANRPTESKREKQSLAAEPNQQDGLDVERRAARQAVAFQFLAAHAGARVRPSKLLAQLAGIDLTRPVQVVSVALRTLHQRGVPGGPTSPCFATEPGVAPERLGMASEALVPPHDGAPPSPTPRDTRVVRFGEEPAPALASTAIEAPSVADTVRGSEQLMIPPAFHSLARTEIQETDRGGQPADRHT